MRYCLAVFILTLLMGNSNAQETTTEIIPSRVVTYKTVDEASLSLHIFNPPDHTSSDNAPAIVFFFGGGFIYGSPKQFYPQSAYLATRGMVAINVEYRIRAKYGTSVVESLKDANSAMRWIKSYADELGINSNMLAAGGGSAGGLLAILVAAGNDFNEDGEDLTISTRPEALVLFNPQFEIDPEHPTYEPILNRRQEFSPMHNLNDTTPPTVVLHGTEDEFIPVSTVRKFQRAMQKLGVRSDLHLYDGQPHEFYNKAKYLETLLEVDKFLSSLSYLSGPSTLMRPPKE
jgi:acetyl esterase/lipase